MTKAALAATGCGMTTCCGSDGLASDSSLYDRSSATRRKPMVKSAPRLKPHADKSPAAARMIGSTGERLDFVLVILRISAPPCHGGTPRAPPPRPRQPARRDQAGDGPEPSGRARDAQRSHGGNLGVVGALERQLGQHGEHPG